MSYQHLTLLSEPLGLLVSGNTKLCDHGKYHPRASEIREQGVSGLNGKSLRKGAEQYEKHL